MKKVIAIILLIVAVGVLTGLSVNKYDNRPRGLTLQHAIAQRDQANYQVRVNKAALDATTKLDAIKFAAMQANYQASLNSTCSTLAAHKLTNQYCVK